MAADECYDTPDLSCGSAPLTVPLVDETPTGRLPFGDRTPPRVSADGIAFQPLPVDASMFIEEATRAAAVNATALFLLAANRTQIDGSARRYPQYIDDAARRALRPYALRGMVLACERGDDGTARVIHECFPPARDDVINHYPQTLCAMCKAGTLAGVRWLVDTYRFAEYQCADLRAYALRETCATSVDLLPKLHFMMRAFRFVLPAEARALNNTALRNVLTTPTNRLHAVDLTTLLATLGLRPADVTDANHDNTALLLAAEDDWAEGAIWIAETGSIATLAPHHVRAAVHVAERHARHALAAALVDRYRAALLRS